MKVVPIKVELLDQMGDDLAVVNAARVSFDRVSESFSEEDEKLIKYLAKHKHWTPFGHCFAKFRIKAPIFVARQLVKHQVGLTWNEVSRRYVDSRPEFYLPPQWRGRAKNVKQGSGEAIELRGNWAERLVDKALFVYLTLLDEGVAPEHARMILPQNTMTEWIWSGSLAAFARVCNLRLDSHTQRETQEVAKQISAFLEKEFPVSWKALVKF